MGWDATERLPPGRRAVSHIVSRAVKPRGRRMKPRRGAYSREARPRRLIPLRDGAYLGAFIEV